jgi:hypothetical protein
VLACAFGPGPAVADSAWLVEKLHPRAKKAQSQLRKKKKKTKPNQYFKGSKEKSQISKDSSSWSSQ